MTAVAVGGAWAVRQRAGYELLTCLCVVVVEGVVSLNSVVGVFMKWEVSSSSLSVPSRKPNGSGSICGIIHLPREIASSRKRCRWSVYRG